MTTADRGVFAYLAAYRAMTSNVAAAKAAVRGLRTIHDVVTHDLEQFMEVELGVAPHPHAASMLHGTLAPKVLASWPDGIPTWAELCDGLVAADSSVKLAQAKWQELPLDERIGLHPPAQSLAELLALP